MKPKKIENLWKGDWPYAHCEGVGIRLDGIPNDYNQFEFILASESCHPKAVERIYNRLWKNSFDLLTVMAGLDFPWLVTELEKIGVKMSIVPPLPGWEQHNTDGPWPEKILKIAQDSKYERVQNEPW